MRRAAYAGPDCQKEAAQRILHGDSQKEAGMVAPTPIQTWYRHILFRSRKEARWAVFFDSLGIPFLYEPEGYELPSGKYLPDFWLPNQSVFWEVKGKQPTEHEEQLCKDLAIATESPVLLHFGDVGPPSGFRSSPISGLVYDMSDSAYIHYPDGWDNGYVWCQCSFCGFLGLQFDGRSARLRCCPSNTGLESDKEYNSDSPAISNAFLQAQIYRFW